MCCSNSFVPRSQPRRLIWKYAFLCGLWNKNCLRRLFLQPPFGYFFSTFLFFVPSLKRRLIPLFVPVFLLCHLLVSLFRCAYIRSFLCYKFFFCIPTDSSFRLRSISPIVRCLGGGYCGNTANSVFRNYIFFGQLFFFYDAAKNNESFSFGCQRGRISNKEISSYLINDCDNICEFLLVKCNKMKNTHSIE